jgi:hypothetical protein
MLVHQCEKQNHRLNKREINHLRSSDRRAGVLERGVPQSAFRLHFNFAF